MGDNREHGAVEEVTPANAAPPQKHILLSGGEPSKAGHIQKDC